MYLELAPFLKLCRKLRSQHRLAPRFLLAIQDYGTELTDRGVKLPHHLRLSRGIRQAQSESSG